MSAETKNFQIDKSRTIIDVFHDSVKQYATSPAFSCMGQSLTFKDIDRLSRQFASYLQHHTQLQPGDRIALQIPNLLQYPVVIFGALRAGMVVVSTNPLYTARELKHQLNDSGAKALVVLSNIADVASQVIKDTSVNDVIVTDVGDLMPPLKRVLVNAALKYVKKQVPKFSFPHQVSFRSALKLGEKSPLNPVSMGIDDIAILQYTGGTTGVAKGAMLTHYNLVSNMEQARAQLKGEVVIGEEVYVAPLPLYHIYAFTLHCMLLFNIGGRSILIPNPRDIPRFVADLKGESVTGFVGINTLFNALCREPGFKTLDLSQLRATVSGGMALNEDAALQWKSVTGVMPVEGYGMTETSPVIASSTISVSKLGTVGKPVPGTELKITDEKGIELPAGEPGELCVRGPQVMKGYWNRPEETAQVLGEDGWLKTGDMALIDEDGYVKIVDRKKELVIVSGFNVYPTEVENVVCQHPGVVEAAVISVPDENTGEAVKLFVVRGDDNLTEDVLRDYCRENFVAYKVPRHIVFRDELPKSPVGKILRRELQ